MVEKTATTVFLVGTNKHLLELREEYPTLEQISQAPTHKLIDYHSKAKKDLITLINKERHFGFNSQTPTISIGQEQLTLESIPSIYQLLKSMKQESILEDEIQFVITGQIPEGPNIEHIKQRLSDLSNLYDVRAQYIPLNADNALTIASGVDAHLDAFPLPSTKQSAMGLFCMKQGVPQWTSRYALRDGIKGGRFIYGGAIPEYGNERVYELFALNQLGAIKNSWQRQVQGVLTDHDLYAAHMIEAIMATSAIDSKAIDRPVKEIITASQQEVSQKYSLG